jgi:hypothetical protein
LYDYFMKQLLAFTLLAASAALLPACGSRTFTPAATAAAPASDHARAERAGAAPTPYPLPKQTPNWGIVEKPTPWDFTSTGPDRSGCGPNQGLTYRVGPNQAYPEPHDVPWLRLLPCDTVLIYPAPTPYSDLIYIASRGRVHQAITVSGVLDAKGNRPILDGSHAVTSAKEGVDPYLLCNGMITIGKPSDASEPTLASAYKPGYLIIENLEIRNAFGKYPGSKQPLYTCTDTKGVPHPWAQFAAGIDVDPAEHVTIRNTYLHKNGLGAFVNSVGYNLAQSRDFYVTDNTILDNGNGNAGLHNFYFEVIGERVIHNYFGPPIANTQGENVKDRSVCLEWSDNYVDSGNHLLTFRDPQSNAPFEWKQIDAFGVPCVSEIYVHGNTLVSRGPTVYQAMSTVVAFGDGTLDGSTNYNRYGSVYFYNNAVVAIGDGNPYAMKAAIVWDNINTLKPSTFYGLNNLFYSMPQTKGKRPPSFAACFYARAVDFTQDWDNYPMLVKLAKQEGSYSGAGAKPCDGSGMSGIAVTKRGDPGFIDTATGDFHLAPGSPFYELAAPLPSAVTQRHLQPDGVQYPNPSP